MWVPMNVSAPTDSCFLSVDLELELPEAALEPELAEAALELELLEPV